MIIKSLSKSVEVKLLNFRYFVLRVSGFNLKLKFLDLNFFFKLYFLKLKFLKLEFQTLLFSATNCKNSRQYFKQFINRLYKFIVKKPAHFIKIKKNNYKNSFLLI